VLLEGPATLVPALARLSGRSVALVLFQAYFATLFCFIAWSHLLKRYPVTTVAPFSLLVPVVGLASGVAFLGEPASGWKLAAAVLVIGGLALSQLEGRLAVFFARS
jgi:O-acetylserine/cysteine efflux transporter